MANDTNDFTALDVERNVLESPYFLAIRRMGETVKR
jgi:hypothetical protein